MKKKQNNKPKANRPFVSSARLNEYMEADRQWPRKHRINYALRCLRFAEADKREEDIAFYREVLYQNGYVLSARKILASTRWSMGVRDFFDFKAYEAYLVENKLKGYKAHG